MTQVSGRKSSRMFLDNVALGQTRVKIQLCDTYTTGLLTLLNTVMCVTHMTVKPPSVESISVRQQSPSWAESWQINSELIGGCQRTY